MKNNKKASDGRLLKESGPPPVIDTAAMFRSGGQALARGILKAGGAIAAGYLLDAAVDLSGNQQVWMDRHRLELQQASDHLQLALSRAIRTYDDEGNLEVSQSFTERNVRLNYRTLINALTPLMMSVANGRRSPTYERLLNSNYHAQVGRLELHHRVGIMFLKAVCLNSESPDIFASEMSYENIQGPAPYYTQCSSSAARCMSIVWGVFYEGMKGEIAIAKAYCEGLTPTTYTEEQRYEYGFDDSCFLPAGTPRPVSDQATAPEDVFWGGHGGAERSPPYREPREDDPTTPDDESREEQFARSDWEDIDTCKPAPVTTQTFTVADRGDDVSEVEIENAQFQLNQVSEALESINAAVILKNRAVASTAPLVGVIDSGMRGAWNNSLGEIATLIPGIENEDVIWRDECGKLPGTIWNEDGVMDYGHR